MMKKEELLESGLLEQFVLGLTNDQENEMVYQAIKKYPELKTYLNKIEQTMETIALQHSIVPPDGVRTKTFNKILESEKLKLRSATSRTISEVLYGVAALVLLAGTFFYYNSNKNNLKALEKNKIELNNLKEACENTDKDLELKTNLLALYEDDQFTTYNLKKSSGQNSTERIVVFWDEVGEKAFLHNLTLSDPPPGKTYQIWADVDQVMIPLGVFNESNEIIEIKCLKNATSLNVTIEPEGGSEHPDVSNLIMSLGV